MIERLTFDQKQAIAALNDINMPVPGLTRAALDEMLLELQYSDIGLDLDDPRMPVLRLLATNLFGQAESDRIFADYTLP